jgi:hypothetical protein
MKLNDLTKRRSDRWAKIIVAIFVIYVIGYYVVNSWDGLSSWVGWPWVIGAVIIGFGIEQAVAHGVEKGIRRSKE